MVLDFRTVGLPALISFRTVSRTGGISAAAKQLGMAKSGVSRHVAQLEEHFGVRLLERGGRTVRLTPVGQRLDDRIRSILAELELLDDIAVEERSGLSGQVTLTSTPEFGAVIAANLFPVLLDEHPNLTLVMKADYGFEDMQDPGTDLAIRVGKVNDDRLIARRLGSFSRTLVAAPDVFNRHPLGRPEDLADQPCLTFRGDRPGGTWRFARGDEDVSVEVAGSVAVLNFSILKDLALAGRGFGFLPGFMLTEELDAGRLVHCLPDWRAPQTSVYLTFRPGMRNIARISAVLDAAEATLPLHLDP
ncbi:MAG: LysR family transcriptional regulator [Pseudomonadota bacterium]